MTNEPKEVVPWWKDAVIYHVYPRSFQDGNGDGVGDLAGITTRLPYIRDLGASAIWMGPVFSSPQVDNGYDISDYRTIDPLFGTREDMELLIERAHELDIRVLLDLVFNHTSDQHRWFIESRDNPGGPYGDWYIWRDAPNNWQGFFSLPAWTWSPERGQYYLHLFTPEQPDLNWENPAVRKELAETANFWLDRGVDGFRLDVINVISKRTGLPSLPPGRAPNGYFIDGPSTAEWLREFRSRLRSDREIVLVGETPGVTPEAARRYTRPAVDPRGAEVPAALDMVLLFDHLAVDHGPEGRWDPRPLEIGALRDVVERWQRELAEPSWPSIYLSNHDQPRVVSRYGSETEFRYESATALATAFYLQRGTPIVYQGDEIAMRNYPLDRPDEIVDIESANAYRKLVEQHGLDSTVAFERVRREARDNGRTPMQWNTDAHAGFTGATPWFPVNPDYIQWNVSTQMEQTQRSVLRYFCRLLSMRRELAVFRDGDFRMIRSDAASPLFAFRRSLLDRSVLVVANLSSHEVSRVVSIMEDESVREVLLCNYAERTQRSGEPGQLRAWETVVFEMRGN